MTASKNVIIVGNGLFGSIAATLCRSRGHTVTVVSNLEPMAASKASGCVLAPSWLSSLSDQQIDKGMKVLNELYTVHDINFQTQAFVKFKAQRVNPDDVIVDPDIVDDVDKVSNGQVRLLKSEAVLKGTVLVAAGVWSGGLIDMPKIRGLYGASVRFQAQLPTPKISVYAPYRQAVAFQLNRKEVWFGDGTALIRKTWESERAQRVKATIDRGQKLLDLNQVRTRINEGVRPYVEGHKAGYFERPFPQTWVSTGGAKNGTMLAAAQAQRFIEEAKL